MAATDGFEQLARGVIAVEQLRSYRDEQNRGMLSIGEMAVHSGEVTSENIVELTLGAVDRHLTMMQEIGIDDNGVQAEDFPKPSFQATSRRVPVGASLEVALRQQSVHSLDANGFYVYSDGHGAREALAEFASPRTTRILGFRRGAGMPDVQVPLAIVSFEDSDKTLRHRIAPSINFFEQMPAVQSHAIRGDREQPDLKLINGDLTVAAGQLIRFSRLLDKIQEKL